MTNPQPNPNEPSREQVEETIRSFPAWCPDSMARWHLTELHRETQAVKDNAKEIIKLHNSTLEEVIVALNKQLAAAQKELRQSSSEVEQAFIERLCGELDKRGINTGDWDGEDSPERILANGIAGLVENERDTLRAQLGEKDRALNTVLSDFKKWGECRANFSEGEFTQDYTTRRELVEKALTEAKG